MCALISYFLPGNKFLKFRSNTMDGSSGGWWVGERGGGGGGGTWEAPEK